MDSLFKGGLSRRLEHGNGAERRTVGVDRHPGQRATSPASSRPFDRSHPPFCWRPTRFLPQCADSDVVQVLCPPKPIAEFQSAPLTAPRRTKKQNPKQVLPVQTRLTDTAESTTGTCHSFYDMRKKSERSATVVS